MVDWRDSGVVFWWGFVSGGERAIRDKARPVPLGGCLTASLNFLGALGISWVFLGRSWND